MADIKVYTPTVIEESPFPFQEVSTVLGSEKTASGIYTPATIRETPLPKKKIATELLSRALNTRARKILGEFQFTPSGAIQIGEYQSGVNGDIRISPNGIVGRDLTGSQSFAIDGETGKAVFRGSLQTGAVVAGNVVVQEGGEIQVQDGDALVVIDSYGLVSSNNFHSLEQINGEPFQTFTTTSFVDVSGSSITFDIPRAIRFLFLLTTVGWVIESVGNTGDGRFALNINGVEDFCTTRFDTGNINADTRTAFYIVTLPAGSHTVKLQGKLGVIHSGSPTCNLRSYSWAFLQLGN